MATQIDGPASLFIALGGWAVAIVIGLFTFIAQMRRGGVEETAVVLGKWKELVEAHEKQIEGLNGEISRLKQRVAELEELAERQIETIKQLSADLEGERRQAQQQARSFRRQLEQLGINENLEKRDGSE